MFEVLLIFLLEMVFVVCQLFIECLYGEDINVYWLFNGSIENWLGLIVDCYGDLLLIQMFYEVLDGYDCVEIENFYVIVLFGLVVVYNDCSYVNLCICNLLLVDILVEVYKLCEFYEMGICYLVQVCYVG